MFCKKRCFLKILQKSQQNTCARLWHRCFPLNFAKILRAPFFTEHLQTTASGKTTLLRIKKSYYKISHWLKVNGKKTKTVNGTNAQIGCIDVFEMTTKNLAMEDIKAIFEKMLGTRSVNHSKELRNVSQAGAVNSSINIWK